MTQARTMIITEVCFPPRRKWKQTLSWWWFWFLLMWLSAEGSHDLSTMALTSHPHSFTGAVLNDSHHQRSFMQILNRAFLICGYLVQITSPHCQTQCCSVSSCSMSYWFFSSCLDLRKRQPSPHFFLLCPGVKVFKSCHAERMTSSAAHWPLLGVWVIA